MEEGRPRHLSVAAHCREIDRCNQRGGRMLSIVDLVDVGTFSVELAAYAVAASGKGASFMTGALPGGAGKTTVMGALLNAVPADRELIAADGLAAIERGMKLQTPACYICHEIGAGDYYAYLWGEPLRRYFELPAAGHEIRACIIAPGAPAQANRSRYVVVAADVLADHARQAGHRSRHVGRQRIIDCRDGAVPVRHVCINLAAQHDR